MSGADHAVDSPSAETVASNRQALNISSLAAFGVLTERAAGYPDREPSREQERDLVGCDPLAGCKLRLQVIDIRADVAYDVEPS